MTHEITIPPQALEAAAIKLFLLIIPDYSWADMPEGARDMWRRRARTACLAMLKHWPGSYSLAENDSAVIRDVAAIILPLTENADV